MIKQCANYGAWIIDRHDDNKIDVYKNGQLCDKTKPALREIAAEIGFKTDDNWNNQKLGATLIKVLTDETEMKAKYGVVKGKEVTIPRSHLCAVKRCSIGTYYIDDIFTWNKQEIYKDVEVLIFPRKGDVAFEKCNEISCTITRNQLPSVKEVRIPKEWKDALVVPKGVQKTYY